MSSYNKTKPRKRDEEDFNQLMQAFADEYSGLGATGRSVIQAMWDDYIHGRLAHLTEWNVSESEIVRALGTLTLVACVIGLDEDINGKRPF
jgi:hypothetical protein